VQGAPLEPFDTTNPAHVFEIHPIVQVNNISILDSFHPIAKFKTKDAEEAFTSYENKQSEISSQDNTTTITTTMGGFNYVEFRVVLNEEPHKIDDGHVVMASVETLDGDLLVRNRRMVFIKGTSPDLRVGKLHKGATLHVLGVPRLVSFRVAHASQRPGILNWSLPYEMVIAGVYPK
jgi:hypothetical protein